ncbi:palmitoyltransferase akr1 [Saitoella coloradoensis]
MSSPLQVTAKSAATSASISTDQAVAKQTPPSPLPADDIDIWVAAQRGDLTRIQHLLDTGLASATSSDSQGITPLHWAAINDHLLVCKLLLQNGADPNARGGDLSATPLHWAARQGLVCTVHLLLRHGADPALLDSQGFNTLHLATHSSHIMLLIYLLHTSPTLPIDSTDPQGHTALMWAAYQGDELSVSLLVRWGADVRRQDGSGLTALHWAVVKGNQRCMKLILEAGADVNARQQDGKTPAKMAIEMRCEEYYEDALKEAGRRPDGTIKHKPFSEKVTNRIIMAIPFPTIYLTLQSFAIYPIYIAIWLFVAFFVAGHQFIMRFLLRADPTKEGYHRTPYLAGIFSGTALLVIISWLTTVAPATFATNPYLNFGFLTTTLVSISTFLRALLSDPGFIPRPTSKSSQRAVIEELVEIGSFDGRSFCGVCFVRRPLRSKHCKLCNRCVARHDHHCPWVANCVGVKTHRAFLVYIITLELSILFFIGLVLAYIRDLIPYTAEPCLFLPEALCAPLRRDPYTALLGVMSCAHLVWLTMLCFVQLMQVARAITTVESFNLHKYGFMGGAPAPVGGSVVGKVVTALATGAVSEEGAQVGPEGRNDVVDGCEREGEGARPCGNERERRRRGPIVRIPKSCVSVLKLLGVDMFLATARDTAPRPSSSAAPRNPFSHGLRQNCADFWWDGQGGFLGLGVTGSSYREEGRDEAWGMVGGERVDLFRMFDVPEPEMGVRRGRGRRGGGRRYERVNPEDEV